MAHEMSEEEISRHVRTYVYVFMALAALTVITVAASYLPDSTPLAVSVGIALLIAMVKGSLVVCYFMHLIDERKLIYVTLAFTAIFFIGLLLLPIFTQWDQVTT